MRYGATPTGDACYTSSFPLIKAKAIGWRSLLANSGQLIVTQGYSLTEGVYYWPQELRAIQSYSTWHYTFPLGVSPFSRYVATS